MPFNIEQGLMIKEGVLAEEIDKVMADAARKPATTGAGTRRATVPRVSIRRPTGNCFAITGILSSRAVAVRLAKRCIQPLC
jgi:hypothetical protein